MTSLGEQGATIGLLVALSVFALTLALGSHFSESAQRRARIRAVARQERRGRLLAPESDARQGWWREALLRRLRGTLGQVDILRERQAATVRARLVRAGFRDRDALPLYVSLKIVAPLGLAGLAAVYLFLLQRTPQPVLIQLFVLVATALAGSYLPDLLLRNSEQRRLQQVRRALPDALDLMVICAEAGLALDASINRVSSEMAQTAPVLAEELTLLGLELRFLGDRRKAVENLSQRVMLPAVQALCSTLIQTERYGTPLARALRVLGGEQRTERMLRAEEKAARLPATMTVPLIIFVLPALFVVLLGPAGLRIMDGLAGH